jgi:hypothetical protein
VVRDEPRLLRLPFGTSEVIQQLAQMAALTAHAKVAMASANPNEFLHLDNSTFQFVRAVSFEREHRRFLSAPQIGPIGHSAIDWFQYLVSSEVRHLDLVVWPVSRRLVLARAACAGSWAIRSVDAHATSLWLADWTPDLCDKFEKRIWSVIYTQHVGKDRRARRLTVVDASERLSRVLNQAETFAREADLSMWGDWLADAARKLGASSPTFEIQP